MAFFYLDTSALVKLYIQEPGTGRLLELVSHQPEHRIIVLNVAIVEMRSAIRRRQREGDIDQESADAILESLRCHMEQRFLSQVLDDAVIDRAQALIDRYALRAYDAMQLAGCVVAAAPLAEPVTFVCADQRLVDAAVSEKLQVINPTT